MRRDHRLNQYTRRGRSKRKKNRDAFRARVDFHEHFAIDRAGAHGPNPAMTVKVLRATTYGSRQGGEFKKAEHVTGGNLTRLPANRSVCCGIGWGLFRPRLEDDR